MRVVGSGVVFDTRAAPINERSASSSAALALAEGTILASFRLGTQRELGTVTLLCSPAATSERPGSCDTRASWERRSTGSRVKRAG